MHNHAISLNSTVIPIYNNVQDTQEKLCYKNFMIKIYRETNKEDKKVKALTFLLPKSLGSFAVLSVY